MRISHLGRSRLLWAALVLVSGLEICMHGRGRGYNDDGVRRIVIISARNTTTTVAPMIVTKDEEEEDKGIRAAKYAVYQEANSLPPWPYSFPFYSQFPFIYSGYHPPLFPFSCPSFIHWLLELHRAFFCLLHPSSGKTTLLDVLAGRKTAGEIGGEIRVNGSPIKSQGVSQSYCKSYNTLVINNKLLYYY